MPRGRPRNPAISERSERRCPRCRETKPLATSFNRNAKMADGYDGMCRQCRKDYRVTHTTGESERQRVRVVGDTAWCSGCKVYKPVTEFHRSRSEKYGLSAYCKVCKVEVGGRVRKLPAIRGSVHKSFLAFKYGITPEQYEWMLAGQGGVCAICGTDSPGAGCRYFSVDHDHETRQIRGLLCNNCNVGIGYFGDDVARLRSAISYLNSAARQVGGIR